MRRDPAAEPRGLCRHVADAVELAHRYWPQRVLTRKQPASRPALQPPCAEQREKLWRQHGMPILAAFAQLDTDQHSLGIDVADPQHDDLAAAQTGTVGDADRGLVLETGPGRGLDQPGDLLAGKHPRQLARVVRAGQLMGEVGAAERNGEEEAQCRDLGIDRRWRRTLLDLSRYTHRVAISNRRLIAADAKTVTFTAPRVGLLFSARKSPKASAKS